MSSGPAPIVIPASQTFDGNDGPWSSFNLQLGTPAQDVTVLISTAGYQTWAVVPAGCTSSDPPNCEASRGGFFQPNQSTTWKPNNVTSKGIFALDLEKNLGYSGNGEYAYDTVGLGWQGSGGPTLEQQNLGGIATKDFYLGNFGLTPRPTNFTNFTHPVPSYMENLKSQNLIPSLSWGYTAGNQYRSSKALGSLTLGGYDSSKLVPNTVSFPFNPIDLRDLTVNLDTIEMETGNGDRKTLSNTTLPMFVDSTVPFIFLPLEVCQQFESAFGIAWNETVQAYLVNDTEHTRLKAQDANITFTLGNGQPNAIVNITLPYAAFDLNASYPLIDSPSRYFPLSRAANESQYTLGRTFFQEAYVTADYERRNFSVSQCNWEPNNQQQNVQAITSPSTNSSSSSNTPLPSIQHLNTSAIVGIVVGCVALTAIIAFLSYFLIVKRSKHRSKAEILKTETTGFSSKPELGTDSPEKPPNLGSLHEADSKQYFGSELGGKCFPGHEVDGESARHSPSSLAASASASAVEMTGDRPVRSELDDRQYPGQELPGNDVRLKLGFAGGGVRHELPARASRDHSGDI